MSLSIFRDKSVEWDGVFKKKNKQTNNILVKTSRYENSKNQNNSPNPSERSKFIIFYELKLEDHKGTQS